jgi:ribonuclease D
VIDTQAKLSDALPALDAAPWIALDTEADSLHAYPEKLCLLQISYPHHDILVDPLARLDLAPLLDIFHRDELILHGADYDLRLLNRTYRFTPRKVFDTMIAARLLGELRFSLGDLVQRFLGITLEKGSQKANWARRPLTERMEAYARNDTAHLKPLSEILRTQLRDAGRLSWHTEMCARLIADSAREDAPDPDLVWRLKGSRKLRRSGLSVLRELWHWRETEAINGNRPPFFVLAHDLLIELADAASHQRPIEPLIPRHISPRRRDGIERAIRHGLALPHEEQPHIEVSKAYHPNEREKRRFTELQAVRDQAATALKLDPSLIAPKALLFSVARDDSAPARAALMSWQRELLKL